METNNFECEVRLINYDQVKLLDRIKELGGYKKMDYEGDDRYFEPKSGEWDRSKNLRLRKGYNVSSPSAIYFSKNKTKTIDGVSFKQSEYEEGKIKFYSGDENTGLEIIDDLGYQEVARIIKTDCQIWFLPEHNFQVIIENVKDFGWSGEIEFDGNDVQLVKKQIDEVLSVLGLDKSQVSFKSMLELFLDKNSSS